MKKISFEELKDKDLYLDDEGKIVVKEKQKGRFLPKYNETYYYVFDFTVCSKINYKSHLDTIIINKDLVFRTKKEVEEYAKYLKSLEKYSYKFTDEELKNINTPKFQLYLYENTIEYIGYGTVHGKIWFKSSNDCDLFIREVGTENIKKFMFNIWE